MCALREVPPGQTRSRTTFKRREGTAGICGHLYETKLLGLLYFRAIHDEKIVEFQLASNVDDIGAFDDVCFKAIADPSEGYDKPLFVFIQAKHKENEKRTIQIDLKKYFDSYLKIREHFNPNSNDSFFRGTFDDTECLFVIYTTAKDDFGDNSVESSFSSHLYDLIGTGGTAKQADKLEQDVERLSKIAIEFQMTSLAARIAKFIMEEEKIEMMLTDELIHRYHVILARKVVDVSEIKPEGHRIASFRTEFFNTHEEYLILFKDTLYKKILKKREMVLTEIGNLLSEFLAAPTDDEDVKLKRLSKLIGTVVIYEDGRLKFSKQYKEYFRPELNQVYVSQKTVNQAMELAAKEILLSSEFELKVPAAFGNKDLTLSGSDAKKEKRITFLKSKIIEFSNKYNSSKIVTIEGSLEDGFLKLNGGLASAIGNIFVLDDNTKLMKITGNRDSLGAHAQMLYDKLNDEIPNLLEYTFRFQVSKFPKLLLERDSYEEHLARDFLNKLLIYSNQADEKAVEEKIKDEIEEALEHIDSRAKTDAIFLKYHNEIQTWWMLPQEAPYLTKEDKIFDKATSYVIEDPVMRSISVPYIKKITQYNYAFTDEAVRSLSLQDQHSRTVIIAENTGLTVVKVMQYLNNKEHVVLDLQDIVNLPTKERNALRRELTSTNKDKVLILVCNAIRNTSNEKKTFENVAGAVQNKKTIIIMNNDSVDTIQKYFIESDHTVYDQKNSLIDMTEDSQKIVLENARVKFQGIEVELEHLVRGWSRT